MRHTDTQTRSPSPLTIRRHLPPYSQPPATPRISPHSQQSSGSRSSVDDNIDYSRKAGSPPTALGITRQSSFDLSSSSGINNAPHLSTSVSTSSSSSSASSSPSSPSQSTWLVFLGEKWIPFDASNQTKLEQTLSLGGTFVDITDSHFKHVKRVRVFPKTNYLSYLGVKYRLSRIMEPYARLDCSEIGRESISYHDTFRPEELGSR